MKLNIYELLGVEEGEVFELNGAEYKFIGCNMMSLWHTGEWVAVEYPIRLLHEAEFKQLPFVPKVGEKYWTADKHRHWRATMTGHIADVKNLELGICYRTEKQAEREGIQKMKALVEKWGGKCE